MSCCGPEKHISHLKQCRGDRDLHDLSYDMFGNKEDSCVIIQSRQRVYLEIDADIRQMCFKENRF